MYVENIVNLAHGAQQAATSAERYKVPNKPSNWQKTAKPNNKLGTSTNATLSSTF